MLETKRGVLETQDINKDYSKFEVIHSKMANFKKKKIIWPKISQKFQ